MSYCLNPTCLQPENSDTAEVCQCGAQLRLGNRYCAIKPIGQGSFGRSFLAVDLTQSDRPLCVIKQFFPNQGSDRLKAAELFRKEAERLKQLDEHPQIPNLLDYLEQDGQQYLIQEFIDGHNLEQELSDRGAFKEEVQRSKPAIASTSHLSGIEAAQVETTATHSDISSKGDEAVAVNSVKKTLLSQSDKNLQKTSKNQLWQLCFFAICAIIPLFWFQLSSSILFKMFDSRVQPIARPPDASSHTVSNLGIVDAIAISADNRTIASLCSRSSSAGRQAVYEIEVRNLDGAQIVESLPAQQHESIAISPDGKNLVSYGVRGGGSDSAVKIWSLETGKLIARIKAGKVTSMAAISPDGQTLATANDRTIELWDLRTGDRIHALPLAANQIESITISPDGKTLVGIETFGSLVRWDLQTGTARLRQNNLTDEKRIVPDQTIITSDRLVVTVGVEHNQSSSSLISYARFAKVWNLDTGEQIRTLDLGSRMTHLALSRNGILAAYNLNDGMNGRIDFGKHYALWNVRSGQLIRMLPALSAISIRSMIFSPDGRNLISSYDNVVKVLPIDSLEL